MHRLYGMFEFFGAMDFFRFAVGFHTARRIHGVTIDIVLPFLESADHAGYYFTGSLPILQVEYQGGLYIYYPSGQLFPSSAFGGPTVSFKTPDCSGTAYFQGGWIPPGLLASLVGSAWRFVNRAITPPFTFGPATAWKLTTTTENIAVATQLKKRDTNGACINDGAPFTGTLITLAETPAPPDGVGPLTVG